MMRYYLESLENNFKLESIGEKLKTVQGEEESKMQSGVLYFPHGD